MREPPPAQRGAHIAAAASSRLRHWGASGGGLAGGVCPPFQSRERARGAALPSAARPGRWHPAASASRGPTRCRAAAGTRSTRTGRPAPAAAARPPASPPLPPRGARGPPQSRAPRRKPRCFRAQPAGCVPAPARGALICASAPAQRRPARGPPAWRGGRSADLAAPLGREHLGPAGKRPVRHGWRGPGGEGAASPFARLVSPRAARPGAEGPLRCALGHPHPGPLPFAYPGAAIKHP